ncbi:MAG TPA: peptidoglycan-binding protein [Cyanobacteria bacterium UBA11149]|nr:peptidoglycan-binding protein [Cyanobacteria bacterium UBA11367]HBE60704.1 peptidoglycan-binding protein [Cyanobacteria bacterium UBA11366]HBK64037.1 peptidoglycan-binding protein [Cyanobacteria bacterium UBA11166]HBR74498.1 peptidoglycan-binding protein [Cyanobacteria bacterium UBA11159]HBS68296.1 peptidoglycan-binding protein [Cyanobacteria bacterium UBA11153]HBW91363.1 peptidoglycan-binding protein [Cyanobacteria bacterium UBA11149]HCA93602.1 peptidoglycan-binding protein [Cyanobacteria
MTTIADYRDCSTAGVRELDLQLIAEMNRLQPGVLSGFDNSLIVLGPGAHDSLQTAAAKALQRAVAKRGVKLQINSAYRTIAQQFVLRNHFENGRCGIPAAADVGKSNHNGALAIDIEDYGGWRSYLESEGWDWIGSFDAVHFDYRGSGTIDIRSLSVKAFQSLWNLNNPEDKIAEDGSWGPATRARLMKTPVTGFAKTYVSGSNIATGYSTKNPDSNDSINIKFDTMREGAKGEQVKRLQEALKARGFAIAVDGIFGSNTTAAVKAFQNQAGIGVDGVVGVMTLEALGLVSQ